MNDSSTLFLTTLFIACGPSNSQSNSQSGNNSNSRVVLQNKGSDTLVNVAQAWAEAYKEVNPNVAIAVTGGGSGTGVSALLNGTVDLANSSRSLKQKEIDLAKSKGFSPQEHIVGYDALAVYIHPDNPISELTIEQVKDIFAEGGNINSWTDMGIEIPGCPSNELVRVSRQNNSGTYAYFKSAVLGKGSEYKLGSKDMHGSKDVVDLVEKTPCSIGYSGLAYATDHIKMPCIKKDSEAACVYPDVKTASDKSYPIARPLFIYTRGEPEGATKEYLEWIKSDDGQCIIFKKGYAPINEITCPD